MRLSGNSYKVKTGRENFRTKPFFKYESGQFATFDIPTILERLKHEENWQKGELNSVILLKSPTIRVLLTLLHEDTEVIFYMSNDSATFEVVEGSLIMNIKNEFIVLNEGEILTIDEKIKYSFHTVEETAFLLTLVSEQEFIKG